MGRAVGGEDHIHTPRQLLIYEASTRAATVRHVAVREFDHRSYSA